MNGSWDFQADDGTLRTGFRRESGGNSKEYTAIEEKGEEGVPVHACSESKANVCRRVQLFRSLDSLASQMSQAKPELEVRR